MMKTLEEVIKALEECMADDAIESEGCYLATDALYYLKMYRSDQIEWDANRKAWDLVEEELVSSRMKYIARLKELDIGTLNNPLDWDELKAMEGKPVWLEGGDDSICWNHKSWVLIRSDFENDNLVICQGPDYGFAIGKEDYCSNWQAYRKERE